MKAATMTRIGNTTTNATVSVGGTAGGGTPSSGALAATVLTGLAGKMANAVSGALNLTGGDAAGSWQGNGNDPYDIEELVAELSDQVDGSPADAGELSRALHGFVQESAALFLARPESRSLTQLQSVIAGIADSDAAASLSSLTKNVDAATDALGSGIGSA